MDEQAGPGVFFNNNNNSVLPGGAKAPQPGDGGGGETARAQYSIPGILHFLQHEWARFEVERAQWEVERAELQVTRLFRPLFSEVFLNAVRQKKSHNQTGEKLKAISITNECATGSRSLAESVGSVLCWEAGQNRSVRLRYLQEVGYTDTILDVKSQRVKALLGLAGDSGERPGDKRTEPMVNGTEPASLKDSTTTMIGIIHLKKIILSCNNISQYYSEETSFKNIKNSNASKLLTCTLVSISVEMCCICECFSQITNNKDALRKTWNPKFTLRNHFDSIRGLAFHPIEPVLITASEDHTLKMWNLQKTAPAKKCAALDVEPIYTFRAHRGPVLCVVMSSSGEQCFSGGLDASIQCWNTPSPNIDPYDSYEPSVLRGALSGHTDAVWGLVYSSAHHRLLSCSADGTVRLWSAADTAPAIAVFNEDKELGVPSSVDLVCSDPAHMVTAFTNGRMGIFNMETRQLVLELESQAAGEPDAPCQINKVLSHPTLPITITAQEDRHIRFYDNNTGDPQKTTFSHDCSVRLWNMESKTCIQEFTAHRKKFDESINDVAFHPTKCYIGSAGADALAKVFV
uniref:Striatin, calmodulin binding protein n=1 Tax=Cyprinus carpio TaxID=7962 RepID=A0A8C1LN55_CYPCA